MKQKPIKILDYYQGKNSESYGLSMKVGVICALAAMAVLLIIAIIQRV
jgi:hypothetical protein